MPRHLNIRSFLFTPSDKPQIFEKAISSQADLIIFDLEDAVSISNKEAARKGIDKEWWIALSRMICVVVGCLVALVVTLGFSCYNKLIDRKKQNQIQ